MDNEENKIVFSGGKYLVERFLYLVGGIAIGFVIPYAVWKYAVGAK